MSVFLQPIYTQTASGSASTITFNNIPQTFTDLQLVVSFRGLTATGNPSEALTMLINADASNNYSNTNLYSNGTGVASIRYSNNGNIYLLQINSATSTSNTFSNGELYIPNYTSSNYKQIISNTIIENNATSVANAGTMIASGLWRNTSAITSLSLSSSAGNINQYSTFSLYGILRQGI